MEQLRNKEEVLDDIRNLVHKKGFIYALCMVVFEDMHVSLEHMHQIDYRARLNTNEILLLYGYLIHKKIDLSYPNSFEDLMELKDSIYKIMDELHSSFAIPYQDKFKKIIEDQEVEDSPKDFFNSGEMFVEPIFYSGTGVYDLQFLDFLERKYKYDKDWLITNRDFDIEKIKLVPNAIKEILHSKSHNIDLFFLKDSFSPFSQPPSKNMSKYKWKQAVQDMKPIIELFQYRNLFPEYNGKRVELDDFDINNISIKSWNRFYDNLLDLYIIRKQDFDDNLNINSFLKNFSFLTEDGINKQFNDIGDYNRINAQPIIQIDADRFLVTDIYLVYQSIYESPYYWMGLDKKYENNLSKNRGAVGEEITYDFLKQAFGDKKVFKSVKVETKRGHADSDIDVLCILGNKALCVQVKSKKLTLLSRKGNDEQLKKDFQGAIQDAYSQGLICRKKILENNSKYYSEDGCEIKIDEKIDEVYIMGITTEIFPSLLHQVKVLLEKDESDPYPLFLSVFDLELLCHYLNEPYDFMYYIKQRISTMDYFVATEEMAFLGYHLKHKLWKIPEYTFGWIDNDFAQLIDKNYYAYKLGVTNITSKNEVINKAWLNENFNNLLKELKTFREPRMTDVIFNLLDYSDEYRNDLIKNMSITKGKTISDSKRHTISTIPDPNSEIISGVTYVSLESNNIHELEKDLFTLCQVRKYRCKGDSWIGFGSLKDSNNIVDLLVYDDSPWEYDEVIADIAHKILDSPSKDRKFISKVKVGRNTPCPCGSGEKYKKCCGKYS